MTEQGEPRWIAFEGTRRIAWGALADVAAEVKKVVDRGEQAPVVIFDDRTSEPIEVDFRGSAGEVRERLAQRREAEAADAASAAAERQPRGPGRPRLGVVSREVTLLPRHWEWLSRQPGGASVALRRLVDEARALSGGRDVVRQSRESAYRFMSAMAGNEPGFEEATRALFAGDAARFEQLVERWPADVRDHARRLAEPSFGVV